MLSRDRLGVKPVDNPPPAVRLCYIAEGEA